MGFDGGLVPRMQTNVLKNCMSSILSVIDKKYIDSCHDISEGGIGVCLSEMAIGGNIGAKVDLSEVHKDLRFDFKLFSESNTRWIIEVKKEKQNDFEKNMNKNNTPFVQIGQITGDKLIITDDGKNLINLQVGEIREKWKNAIWNKMG